MNDPSGLYGCLMVPFNALRDLPLSWFGSRADELRIAMKALTRFQYDNKKLYLDFNGSFFSVMVIRSNCPYWSLAHKQQVAQYGKIDLGAAVHTLTLWDSTGARHIYESSFVAAYSDPIPADVLKLASERLWAFIDGKVKCSDCGEDTGLSNRRYFAGSYCEPCWTGEKGKHKGKGGMREVERKETYT